MMSHSVARQLGVAGLVESIRSSAHWLLVSITAGDADTAYAWAVDAAHYARGLLQQDTDDNGFTKNYLTPL